MTTVRHEPHVEGWESAGEIIGRLANEVRERETTKAPARWAGVRWIAMLAVLIFVVDAGTWLMGIRSGMVLWPTPGIDFATYQHAAESWVSGTGFYLPYELAGPFNPWASQPQPVLYPPTTAPLFLVLTALPTAWWITPFLIVGWKLRHADLGRWALVAALIAWPGSFYAVVTGNPGLWLMTALSLGLGSVILLKPTLAPFLIVGIRGRRWWLGALALVMLSFALLPMWVDYLTVLRNVRGSDHLYSIWQMPLIAVGAIATRPR